MITHAAVKFNINGNEIIIPCHRHADAYMTVHVLRPDISARPNSKNEGFLNEKDEFLTRQEAWVEAQRCNQILNYEEAIIGELYSEDLW